MRNGMPNMFDFFGVCWNRRINMHIGSTCLPLCQSERYHQRFLKPVQAWEPVEVCMLFTGEGELEAQEVPKGWWDLEGGEVRRSLEWTVLLWGLCEIFLGEWGEVEKYIKNIQKHWCVGGDEEFDGWFLESFEWANVCNMHQHARCIRDEQIEYKDNLDLFDLLFCALCRAKGPSDQGPV